LKAVFSDLAQAVAAESPCRAMKPTLRPSPSRSGRTVLPQQAQDAHAFVRGLVAKTFSDDIANALRIQYGGSVKPDNVDDLMAQPDIDGALVGGASLKTDSFLRIVQYR